MENGYSLKVPITAAILNLILLAVESLGWILTFRELGYVWGVWGYVDGLFNICQILGGTTLLILLLLKNIVSAKKLIVFTLITKFILYPVYFATWVLPGNRRTIQEFIDYVLQIAFGYYREVGFLESSFLIFLNSLGYLVVCLFIYFLLKKPTRDLTTKPDKRNLLRKPDMSMSLAQELERLQQMYQSGSLSEEEFTVAKKRVLGN